MAKKTIQIYVRVAQDKCAHALGTCNAPRGRHPLTTTFGTHDFVQRDTAFVSPTAAERRAIYEQLKEEFDA